MCKLTMRGGKWALVRQHPGTEDTFLYKGHYGVVLGPASSLGNTAEVRARS